VSASLERLFGSIAEKSARLMFNIDPVWVERAGYGLVSVAAVPRDAHADRLVSSALQTVYEVRWPSLGALAQRVHRLAVLPLGEVLRVLQAVALYERRSAVRRCIGRSARAGLVERVGQPAFDVIVATPGADASHPGEIGPADTPVGVLARSGFQALEAHGGWVCPDAHRLVSLCFSPDGPDAVAGSAPPSALDALIERLDLLFPEHAWLFGCDMDKALSASPTV
jgi:Bacterial type III secretion protein (HrpB4)